MHGFSGQGLPPTLEKTTGTDPIDKWRQLVELVEADRVGVGARGKQVECRVLGGRSCVVASGTNFGGVV